MSRVLALSNIAWIGIIWAGILAAIPLLGWLTHRHINHHYNELDQTAPRPPTFPRCLPTETFRRRNYPRPQHVQQEIARLETLYNLPPAERTPDNDR